MANHWNEDLRVSAAFLTRLPVALEDGPAPGRLAQASWAFPVVGLAVGIIGGLVYGAAHGLGLPPGLAALFAVGAQIVLTGGLHEDGLGDLADALGGGASRQRRLEIMRDSRIGSFGALALILVVTARIAALSALAGDEMVIAALVVAGVASRASMAAVMHLLAPARSDGLGAEAGRPDTRNVAIALVIAVVSGLAAVGLFGSIAGLLGAGTGAGGLAWIAWRKIGGQTGDVLGACQQAAEVSCLCVMVAMI